MPSLLVVSSDGVTHVSLDEVWRIHIQETEIASRTDSRYFFSIVFQYPPASADLIGYNIITLLRSQVTVAKERGEVGKVAEVALDGGSEEKDKDRVKEAFELFRNAARIKGSALDSDVEQAHEIINVYWQIQEWLAGDRAEKKEILSLDTKLILRP